MAAPPIVLVVDDDADIRDAIRRIVTKCGYSALTASDARAALRAAQAADGPIRLLITDVWMPGDVSASTLAEQLAGLHANLCVVYISGLPKQVAVGKGLVGANANFLEKPFTSAQLTDTIRAALAAAEPR
jgi:DNA-binding NtrC family response regulator